MATVIENLPAEYPLLDLYSTHECAGLACFCKGSPECERAHRYVGDRCERCLLAAP